ncbi:hypothetical protein K461DRAFT_268674 [Myriangium duriaei CBS 260.36]|uniref:Uncharacterized protein n=1 Tax=Myriangium duriaei CBS 260.36 TaxID=1168546 RepID=A0A9P4MMI8_9PEZI|nr:hypothetical protein K461DRAFT_268674 [Myriangium duriaei CBS 260.36]
MYQDIYSSLIPVQKPTDQLDALRKEVSHLRRRLRDLEQTIRRKESEISFNRGIVQTTQDLVRKDQLNREIRFASVFIARRRRDVREVEATIALRSDEVQAVQAVQGHQ